MCLGINWCEMWTFGDPRVEVGEGVALREWVCQRMTCRRGGGSQGMGVSEENLVCCGGGWESSQGMGVSEDILTCVTKGEGLSVYGCVRE